MDYEYEFKDLLRNFQSIGNEYHDYLIQKVYSNFTFSFFNYQNVQNVSLCNRFLLKNLNNSKFITYCFIKSQKEEKYHSFLNNLFHSKSYNSDEEIKNVVNIIFCIEKKCIILESVPLEFINKILNNNKIEFINVTQINDEQKRQEEYDAINEVKMFLDKTKLSSNENFNFFFQITIFPILSFLIHRFFYPTRYFKDPSFFSFNNDNESFENNFIQKINNFLISNKVPSIFISNYQQLTKEVENEINKKKESNQKPRQIIEFNKRDFIKLKTLFTNKSSTYHLVIHIKSLYIFMMKTIHDDVFIHEIEFCKFLAKNPNKNFTQFYGFIKEKEERIASIIYDYACNGTLNEYISKHNDEIFIFTTAVRIFQGIQYLQKNLFVHRDLKPLNILIDHDGKALISDFETIRIFNKENNDKEILAQNSYTINIGSFSYGAPELLIRNAFHITTDIYCYGEIIYFLFEKKDIFNETIAIQYKENDKIPEMTCDLIYINQIYHSCLKNKYDKRCSMNYIEKKLYSQFDSFSFLKHYILNEENKFDLLQFFTEILMLVIQFDMNYQLNDFFNSHIFSFLFINSSFENDKSDLLFILGTFFYKGEFVKKDDSKALLCFLHSSDFNNLNAFLALGDIYFHGNIVIMDRDKASFYYSKQLYIKYNAHLYFDYFFESANYIQIEYYNFKHYLIMNDEYHNNYPLAFIEYLYSHFYGVKKNFFKDEKNSNKYFENSPTFLYIGHLLHYGKEHDSDFYGNKYNDKISFDNFDELIKENQQDSDVLNSIGFLYLHGIIFQKDLEKSKKFFKLSSNKNNEDALLNLGNIYFYNEAERAKFYYDKAIAVNKFNSYAYAYLGNLLYMNKIHGYFTESFNYVKKSAELNNKSSLNLLGYMFLKGIICEKNLALANHYVNIAANMDFPYSNNILGNNYRIGRCGEQNYSKSRFHYEMASRHFYANAIYELGLFYNNGEGVDVDIAKAIEYYLLVIKIYDEKMLEIFYRKFFIFDGVLKLDKVYYLTYNNLAVISIIEPFYFNIMRADRYFKEAGFSEYCFSQNNLGLFYQFYLDDIENAKKMYLKSSKQMFSLAFFNLGILYENEKEINESIKYLIQASDNEDNDIFMYGDPIYDNRLKVSIIYIVCFARLKICLFYMKNKLYEKAKDFFIQTFSQLEKKFQKYKFIFGINDNHEYKFNFQFNRNKCQNYFSYLESFILNYPLFNLRNQKNINMNSLNIPNLIFQTMIKICDDENKLLKFYDKHYISKVNNNIDNVELLFNIYLMSPELKNDFIHEIELIINIMKKILYTPPYQILFGRIWINHDEDKINDFNINHDFYEGLGNIFQ